MASKPYQPKAPAQSKGFNLDSLTSGVTDFLSQYSTVQIKNGSQAVLAVRGDSGNVATPLQTGAGGTLSIASTSKALSNEKAALAFQKSKGFWNNLPQGAKIVIIAGGALLLVGGGVFLYLK